MERIVEIGGKAVLLGLEWSKLAGDKPVDSARRLAALRKRPMGIIWSVSVGDEESSQVINSLGLSREIHKGAIYSGAAAIAEAHDSVIGIQLIDDDLYWLVVTENGRVLPGYDAVCSEFELGKKLIDLASDTQTDYMQSYMDDETALVFSIHDYISKSPLELISEASIKEQMRVKKMAGIPRSVFMGVGIVALGGILFGYTKYVEYEKQKELERLIALESMSLDDIEDEITVDKVIDKGPTDADILRQARQQEIVWLRDDFNRVNLISAMKGVLFTLNSMPDEVGGWKVKGITFNVSSAGIISIFWERLHGSPDSLKSFIGKRAATGFTPDFKSANSSFPVKLGSPGIVDILSVVKDQKTAHQDLATSLIERSIQFTSGIIDNTVRRREIKGLSDKTLGGMTQLEVSKRLFSLSGDSIDSFVNSMYVLESVDNFLLDTIEIIPGRTQASWKVEGTLYE